jgi:hypothetical protein
MADKDQQPDSAGHFFNLVEKNLPEQETDDENESISVLEFIYWMLGISVGVIFISYLYHLLF